MTLKKDFGKKIKELREALFLSQESFAEKIGIHRNTLARIESGENFVSYETLGAMKEALGVEYKDLFTFDTPVQKDTLKAFKLKLAELNENDAKYFLTSINAYLKAKKDSQNA